MNLILDHLAVAGQSRDAARDHIEAALGLPMQTGGAHARFGTHNHLIGLSNNLYLEAISVDPDAPAQQGARWFDLDAFTGAPRLTNWICAVENMEQALQKWPEAGRVTHLTRGDLRWDMAVPDTGRLPFDNLHPALIRWHGSLHPAQMLAPSGADLTMLTIHHPRAATLAQRLGRITGPACRFETAEKPALTAEFLTPHGTRTLT